MTLVGIVIVLIIIGVLLYVVNTFIPMDAKIKTVLNIVVLLVVILWLVQIFGLLGPINSIRVK